MKALKNPTVTSVTVRQCKQTVSAFRNHFSLGLEWVKGHAGNTGNEVADCMAKIGCEKSHKHSVPISSRVGRSKLVGYYDRIWQRRWDDSEEYRHTKEFYPEVRRCIRGMLRYFGKAEIARLIQMATGHCLLAYHIAQWQEGIDQECRLCAESVERPIHLLNECPALWRARLDFELRVLGWGREPFCLEKAVLAFFGDAKIRKLEHECSAFLSLQVAVVQDIGSPS